VKLQFKISAYKGHFMWPCPKLHLTHYFLWFKDLLHTKLQFSTNFWPWFSAEWKLFAHYNWCVQVLSSWGSSLAACNITNCI